MGLNPGTQLGTYEVAAALGAGGMGEVYRARDTRLGRDVALKILPARLTSDAVRVHRFQQEARAASALNHPHIVALFDTGSADGTHFIVMELVEGRPLTEWVKRARPELARILDVITQVGDALDAAHRAGILHRDIKPANLLVTAQGYAKVVDFGLAKLTEAATEDATQSLATEAGAVMGTAAFMSPEQALGRPVDARTDVFSLGAVLYEAVPANARSRAQAAWTHCTPSCTRRRGRWATLCRARPQSFAGCWTRRWPKTPTSATSPCASLPRTCGVCAGGWTRAKQPPES